MRFFLGTHQPSWLRHVRVPLYVSQHALSPLASLPRLVEGGTWALDSGYTELTGFGRWRMDAPAYAKLARRYHDEIGPMSHCAQLDWPCEAPSRRRACRSPNTRPRRSATALTCGNVSQICPG